MVSAINSQCGYYQHKYSRLPFKIASALLQQCSNWAGQNGRSIGKKTTKMCLTELSEMTILFYFQKEDKIYVT